MQFPELFKMTSNIPYQLEFNTFCKEDTNTVNLSLHFSFIFCIIYAYVQFMLIYGFCFEFIPYRLKDGKSFWFPSLNIFWLTLQKQKRRWIQTKIPISARIMKWKNEKNQNILWNMRYRKKGAGEHLDDKEFLDIPTGAYTSQLSM